MLRSFLPNVVTIPQRRYPRQGCHLSTTLDPSHAHLLPSLTNKILTTRGPSTNKINTSPTHPSILMPTSFSSPPCHPPLPDRLPTSIRLPRDAFSLAVILPTTPPTNLTPLPPSLPPSLTSIHQQPTAAPTTPRHETSKASSESVRNRLSGESKKTKRQLPTARLRSPPSQKLETKRALLKHKPRVKRARTHWARSKVCWLAVDQSGPVLAPPP